MAGWCGAGRAPRHRASTADRTRDRRGPGGRERGARGDRVVPAPPGPGRGPGGRPPRRGCPSPSLPGPGGGHLLGGADQLPGGRYRHPHQRGRMRHRRWAGGDRPAKGLVLQDRAGVHGGDRPDPGDHQHRLSAPVQLAAQADTGADRQHLEGDRQDPRPPPCNRTEPDQLVEPGRDRRHPRLVDHRRSPGDPGHLVVHGAGVGAASAPCSTG